MRAAIFSGQPRLISAPHRADGDGTEVFCPLTDEGTDPAGGSMNENSVTGTNLKRP